MLRSRLLLIVVVLIAITAGVWFFGMRPKNQVPEHPAANPVVGEIRAPTISRETTYLTEPIDSDGFVDYIAALNDHLREGITVDTNAAVLFAKAGLGINMGPNRRARCLEMLGVTESDLLVPGYDKWADRADQRVLKQVTEEPWNATDFPEVLKWLEHNEEPLRVIVDGINRPRCYYPLLTDDGEDRLVLKIHLDMHQDCRDVAKCLVARAMLHLGNGRIEDAKRDLLACHRLGRLMGQTPHLICGLVCMDIDITAWRGDAALLRFGNLDAAAALEFQRVLGQLAPFPTIADQVDLAERIQLLDAVTWKWKAPLPNELMIAFDESLRHCNREFDRYVDALRLATFSQRDRALNVLFGELRETMARNGDPSNYLSRVLAQKHSPEVTGRMTGEYYLTLLMPDISTSVILETKARARIAMLQLGLAVVAYRVEIGQYPEKLDELAPRFIHEVPLDPFSGNQFYYKNEGDAFSLQSLGADGKDDRINPDANGVPGDDVILFVTRPDSK